MTERTETKVREELKSIVRERRNYMKWEQRYRLAMKVKKNGESMSLPDGQSYTVSDGYRAFLEAGLSNAEAYRKKYEKELFSLVHELPVWEYYYAAKPGIGEITIAYLEALVDLDRATNDRGQVVPSKVKRFCGYAGDLTNGVKGKKRPYCQDLKIQLRQMADSMVKGRNGTCNNEPSEFGVLYDDYRHRLDTSERLVEEKAKNQPAKLVPWKDTKASHRYNASLRYIVEKMLIEYVKIRCEIEGRECRPPYGEGMHL